jgi:hypothetical protein
MTFIKGEIRPWCNAIHSKTHLFVHFPTLDGSSLVFEVRTPSFLQLWCVLTTYSFWQLWCDLRGFLKRRKCDPDRTCQCGLGCHLCRTRYGVTGCGMIPHGVFWRNLPGLARDGCQFCCTCLRRRAGMPAPRHLYSYEEL